MVVAVRYHPGFDDSSPHPGWFFSKWCLKKEEGIVETVEITSLPKTKIPITLSIIKDKGFAQSVDIGGLDEP